MQRSICYVDRFNDGSDGEAYAVSDMSEAYFGKNVVRGMRMTADKKWIVVRDEFDLADTDNGYWFAHTRSDIEISDDGKSAVLTENGESIYLAVLGEGSFGVMNAELMYAGHNQEDQFDNSKFKKLVVKFSGKGSVAVAITALYDGKIPAQLPENTSISEW